MIDQLRRIHRLLDGATQSIALIGACALTLTAAGILVNVLSRWLLNTPIKGVEDLSSYAFAVTICCFFPMGLIQCRNVSVRFLGAALGLRVSHVLEALAAIVTTVVVAIFTIALIKHASYVSAQGLTSLTLEWTQAPWWWAAATLFAISLPVQAWVLFLAVLGALTGREILSDAEDGSARPGAALTE